MQAGTVCAKQSQPEPPASNDEITGSVFVRATLKAGRVVQVDVDKNTLTGTSDRRVLRKYVAAIEAAMKDGYSCEGDNIVILQEFVFKLK